VRAYSHRHGRLRFTFSIDRRAHGADGFSGDINPASGIKRECIGISGGKPRRGKSRRSEQCVRQSGSSQSGGSPGGSGSGGGRKGGGS
jgi:hypothetical protein